MNALFASTLQKLRSDTEREVVLTVTPALAQAILDTSAGNRAIAKGTVSRYAREMRAGLWDAEAPIFLWIDPRGRLMDGHHRLAALIEAGVTLKLRFLVGVVTGHLVAQDGGRVRGLRDRFLAYCPDKAVRELVQGHNGRACQSASVVTLIYRTLTGERQPGLDPAIRLVRHYGPSLSFALDMLGSNHLTRTAPVLTGVTLGHKYVTEHGGIKALTNFVETLGSGEMLESSEPAYALRRYLIAIQTKGRQKARNTTAKTDSQWITFIKVLWTIRKALEGQLVQKLPLPSDSVAVIEEYTGPRRQLAKQLKLDAVGLETPPE